MRQQLVELATTAAQAQDWPTIRATLEAMGSVYEAASKIAAMDLSCLPEERKPLEEAGPPKVTTERMLTLREYAETQGISDFPTTGVSARLSYLVRKDGIPRERLTPCLCRYSPEDIRTAYMAYLEFTERKKKGQNRK